VSYTIDIDRERQLVRFVGCGLLSRDEFLRCVSDAASRPGFEDHFGHLVDLRAVDELEATMGDFSERVDADARLVEGWPSVRVALVCSSDLMYGISRMYQSLSNVANVDVEIFREIDEAERWLAEHENRA